MGLFFYDCQHPDCPYLADRIVRQGNNRHDCCGEHDCQPPGIDPYGLAQSA